MQLKERNALINVGATESNKGKTTNESHDELLDFDGVGVIEEVDNMRQQSGAKRPVPVFVSHPFMNVASDVMVYLVSYL